MPHIIFYFLALLLVPLQCRASLNPTEKNFAAFLETRQSEHPSKPLAEKTLAELRSGISVLAQYIGNAVQVSYVDQHVPTRDGTLLPVRIYNDHLPDPTPVLIFYPGCAYIFDVFEINRDICSRIATHSGIKVIFVQFRLAPENPMPTSIYDGYDAASYLAAHAEEYGIDPDHILLGGWCSGAHCAAAVSSLARQNKQLNISHQILLSGTYDLTESNHAYDEQEKEDKAVDRALLRHIAKEYYNLSENDDRDPLMSPYFETDFDDYPSTTLLFGEYDALRNDSEAYFDKLKTAGIQVERVMLPGQTHNTVMMRKVLSDGLDPAEVIANIIKKTQTAWERVQLASYPRSGNHWVRYLIEEVTGVATGSVFCDSYDLFPEPLTVDHDANHRPWGGYMVIGGYEGDRSEPTPGHPVLIKTHYPVMNSPDDHDGYLRTIRLVRDPREAIRSWRKGVKPKKRRLISLIKQWAEFQNYWDKQSDVITIRYEDLKEAPEEELTRIITAMGYPVDCQAIRSAVKRYPPRSSRINEPNFYTKKELKLFDTYAGQEMAQLGY